MKKIIIILIGVSVFAVDAIAQDVSAQDNNKNISIARQSTNPYCAFMRDGKLKVKHEDKELSVEVVLTNGSKITPDAYLVKKDSSRTALKEGECIDKDGNIVPNPKDKAKRDVAPDNY